MEIGGISFAARCGVTLMHRVKGTPYDAGIVVEGVSNVWVINVLVQARKTQSETRQ
jgi:hypothetical protein